jgi:phage/plasmid-associated DNA primase
MNFEDPWVRFFEEFCELGAIFAARGFPGSRDLTITDALYLARSELGVAVSPGQLDADPWALNNLNGTIDLRSGERREHRRRDLITKIVPVAYGPGAEAQTWQAVLERWLPSGALRQFVQRVACYALTGDVSEQVLPFLCVPGANGKTTFINTLLAAAGDYGQEAAPDLLLAKRGGHPTELADLFGARLVASVELDRRSRPILSYIAVAVASYFWLHDAGSSRWSGSLVCSLPFATSICS